MSKATCSIVENGKRCSIPVLIISRGWCSKHYQRWQHTGDPLVSRIPGKGTGRTISRGYVRVHRPDHPLANSWGWVDEHRMVAYDAGILTDLSDAVHHVDGDRLNNAVENLEALSPSEHSHHHMAALNGAKTHCPRGHAYDEANTYISPRGSRICRACARLRDHERRKPSQ